MNTGLLQWLCCVWILLATCVTVAIPPARGQTLSQSYPTQPIRVIVPTGSGSAPDVVMRSLAQKLSLRLGQPVVVENRPGAAGMIGANTVAKAPRDGYTLLLAWDGVMAINPLLYKEIGYAPLKDFVPVAAVGRVEFVLVAHPTFPANSVRELIELAKARPGRINYASAGTGEVHHIAMEALKSQAGIDLTHIAYKGGPAALNDVLGGHVPIGFIGLTPALAHLRIGKLKALGVLGMERVRQLPTVPTLGETLPGYAIDGSWLALFAPAGTPEVIVRKLGTDLNELIRTDEFSSFLAEQGIAPLQISQQGLSQLVRDDTVRFRKIIEQAHIRLD
ncbi:hypothetical protein D9M68_500760 [compost metagenome]